MGQKKQLSGAQKRKKKREKAELAAEMERLKLGPTKVWTGLVVHHKVNRESQDVLAYAGVDVSKLGWSIVECTSISTLEWMWDNMAWGEKIESGRVVDQAWFCAEVAETNKLEFLEWAREVKHCEWDEMTINKAAYKGNLEMLKYCFSNECPYEEKEACFRAAIGGYLDCLRFLFDKAKPSRETEKEVAIQATGYGRVNIVKYFVEERKMSDAVKESYVANAAGYGQFDCLKYLVEEAKVPLYDWHYVAYARYHEHADCLNYLLEKGSPEPTDEEYARLVERMKEQQ